MPSTDDRVVQMQFDSAAFEKKVADVIGSLDKLKTSLDFSSAKKGMEDLSSAGRSFELNGIANAVEGISSKFTSMGAIAFTVIQNVVNRAVDAGIQLGKSLSLDQVISGFQEYETNMNSIQTIMSNTRSDATTLEDVNAALDELNTYSDATIYNFSQMAKNIGTFTAAGVNLETSTSAIKGIANLAAVSGSSADQASNAMYQLSQALSTGTLKLMDWNSVVNAGMGGEVFQKALFETGKALGTLKDVRLDETFEEWTSGGNSFRSTLESGWVTTEVLTNTLQGFTGDLTEAQLLSLGYSHEQAVAIMATGEDAKKAATKVKTFTQLISTLKESIGSGWSQTFRTIFGDFEEARTLFSGLNDALGGLAAASADSRNKVLQDWKDLGGRKLLIESIMYAFNDLMVAIKPIKDAFREMFPPTTGIKLYELTLTLREFLKGLELSKERAAAVKTVFLGLFSAFKIGWEVIKNLYESISELYHRFFGKSEGLLSGLAGFSEKIIDLRRSLVDGGGIEAFFDKWTQALANFITLGIVKFREIKETITDFITYFRDGLSGMTTNEGEGILLFANRLGMLFGDIKDKVAAFVKSFDMNDVKGKLSASLETVKGWFDTVRDLFDKINISGKVDGVKGSFDDLGGKFEWLKGLSNNLKDAWGSLVTKVGSVKVAFKGISDHISDTFGSIPTKLKEVFSGADMEEVLNIANTGIFAGVLLVLNKITDPFKRAGGLVKDVSNVLKELTDTLEAMQLKLKAEALKEIAVALALLTASVVVLSFMNADALTKSMAALAIGFGYLVTAMALLDKIISGPVGAAKLATLATALVIMAGAMLVLAAAAKIFATMSWEELSKGMAGIVAMMTTLAIASKPLSANSSGMVRAGVGIMAIAVAMNIMALAVKSFAEMEWESMGKGLAGVAASLLAVAGATQLMPSGMVLKGVGLIAIATALNIMALAVKSFAGMNWADMGKGLAGIAASLLILAGAMQLMPNGLSLALQGAGMVMIGAGLKAISYAVIAMSKMSWEEMAKGLASLAGVLLILAGATAVMQGTIGGAIAIGIVALAMGKLADGLKAFAKMKWGDLLKGLAGLAAVLLVLALGTLAMEPLIPALLGLGLALAAVGLAFTLFGAGAFLVASALGILAKTGSEGVAVLLEALDGFIDKLPAFIAALGEGVIEIVKRVVAALPEIIPGLSKALTALLQLVIDNIPKIMETLKTLILEGLQLIRDIFPEIVKTGFDLLMSLLHGIEDNIGEIVKTVVNIITNFLDALGEKVPELIDSVWNFIVDVIKGVIEKAADVGEWLLPIGADLLKGLWDGIVEGAKAVGDWFVDLPGMVLDWIGDVADWLHDKGWDFLVGLIKGVTEKAVAVELWFVQLPFKILGWLGDALIKLSQWGRDLVTGMWHGITTIFDNLIDKVKALPGKFIGWLGDAAGWLTTFGKNVIVGLWNGLIEVWNSTTSWASGLPKKFVGWLGDALEWLKDFGQNIIQGLWNGIKAGEKWLVDKVKSVFWWVVDPVGSLFGIHSPSTFMMGMGEMVMQGFVNGIDSMQEPVEYSSKMLGQSFVDGFQPHTKPFNDIVAAITDRLTSLSDFQPVITPVLDLTQVQNGSSILAGMFGSGPTLRADASIGQANLLATRPEEIDTTPNLIDVVGREIKFTQINHSPKALSTSEIYKNTRNQLAMAKEALVG